MKNLLDVIIIVLFFVMGIANMLIGHNSFGYSIACFAFALTSLNSIRIKQLEEKLELNADWIRLQERLKNSD